MNKGTLTAIVQHCISCYCIFAILTFHLHWNNTQTDHLRSCFPCHASTLQIIVETSKVAFSDFLLHPLPDSHLRWVSYLMCIHAEELDDSPYSWNRSTAEYMSLHCDLLSLVSDIHSKIFALPET